MIYNKLIYIKWIIEKFIFWHISSKIFKKSTWWALVTQTWWPKHMEDPVYMLNFFHLIGKVEWQLERNSQIGLISDQNWSFSWMRNLLIQCHQDSITYTSYNYNIFQRSYKYRVRKKVDKHLFLLIGYKLLGYNAISVFDKTVQSLLISHQNFYFWMVKHFHFSNYIGLT